MTFYTDEKGNRILDDSDSDSYDDEYGEFSFCHEDPYVKKSTVKNNFEYINNPEEILRKTIEDGDLNDMIDKINELNVEIDNPINYDTTMLHYACRYGQVEIVKYLLKIGANVNNQIQSDTPLIEACGYINKEKPENALEIVKMLLENDAVINISNKYGKTPFMFACQYGNLDIVKMLIDKASLEACDNEGKTVIYHAIENNHIEIVKYLIENGINCDVLDNKGYSPLQAAENMGFQDIYELLPKEEPKYILPSSYRSYYSVHDYIPRIFLKSDIPEYFQEVYKILNETHLSEFVDLFAIAGIGLSEFLTVTDKRLQEIGIQFPYQRNRIRMGLLHFHLNHWRTNLIANVKPKKSENFYDILKFTANHLQQLIVINSTIEFVQNNLHSKQFGVLNTKQILEFKCAVKKYKIILNDLKDTAKYLNSFSPKKPPLYIEYIESDKGEPKKFTKLLKYSFIIGISIVIWKMRKTIFFKKIF